MDKIQSFQEFLASSSADISITTFLINLIIVSLLSSFLAWVYRNHGRALSNRDSFSRNFMMLSMTIMVIITIVKSSLALSLGLVGALSIVRYRTAVKEPEELAFTFLAIAIGLGMGANQVLITILSFSVIMILVVARSKLYHRPMEEFGNFRIYGPTEKINIEKITDILINNSVSLKLKRFDKEASNSEILFSVIFVSIEEMVTVKKEIMNISEDLDISYFENIGSI